MRRFEAVDGLQVPAVIEVEHLDCTVILSSEEKPAASLVYREMIEVTGVAREIHASF